MRVLLAGLLIFGLLVTTSMAEARSTDYKLKIADVLNSAEGKQKLGSDVAFYFADQKPPSIAQTFGEYISNKKSNSFGRPDEEACQRAMLSALIEFRERALKEGGNAVTNLVSYYQKVTFSSDTDYQCYAGGFVAGVALKGTVVKLKK